jgi:hypothetical protein
MKVFFSILLFCCLLICKQGYTQVDLYNTGTLYSSNSSDILYINGNFTNTSSATLTNSGSLYVRLDLSNSQASMAVGTGTLYLNGTTSQSVSGTQTFKTYHLNTNNSSGITLNNNLSVSGTHTFASGLIVTSATPNYLVYEAGSSYTGDNDSRHVNGWVKKYGTTNFVFPVGNATYERTAAISNLSASSEINCHYYINSPNVANFLSPLVLVQDREYWQIDKISGGTAQVTLNWNSSKVALHNILLTDIVVAHYTGGNWTDVGTTATGNPLTTGSVTSNAVSSFSPFTFGYKSIPVPLKLTSFTGERRSGVSFLHWITMNEENVSHFEVQRSDDGSAYRTIGAVPARNLQYQQYYDYEDNSSIQGIAYYRIKSDDVDGKFTYSRIVALTENEFNSGSFVVLNPVRSVMTVFNKTGKDGLFDYRLLTAAGQLVLSGNVKMQLNGNAVLPLPSQTAAGIYVLELSNANTQFRQKILVER